jgi:hypothetical protein
MASVLFLVSVDVDVPADAKTAIGIPTVADISATAGLPSSFDVCDVPIVTAAVQPS